MKRTLLATVLIAFVVAPVALARRKATPKQHAAVVAAAVAAHDIGSAQGRCAKVFISTVNSSWASLSFAAHPSVACAPYAANGIALLHKRNGHWRLAAVGSSFRCPIGGVPTAIAHDLKACP